MVTMVMRNVSRSFCHQAPSAGGGGAGRRSIFDGDKFDIFREGAEGQETAALFSRSVQQGKGEPHDSSLTRSIWDAVSKASSDYPAAICPA